MGGIESGTPEIVSPAAFWRADIFLAASFKRARIIATDQENQCSLPRPMKGKDSIMNSSLTHFQVISLALLTANTLLASNWPAWRGPEGNGIAPDTNLPL